MSHPEVILWSRLKRLREHGFHIRRQAPFRGYFLDFVCYARRLVIEVDGSQHSEDRQADHDLVRDAILRREGFRVLRVSAAQVRNHVTAVMDQIIAELEAAPSTRDADPDERRLAHTSPP
jgi:very-short-patch-repair endonuclease